MVTDEQIIKAKAEIERFADIGKMYSEVRAEAIKEFAERLKNEFEISSAYSSAYIECQIDNIVKEMTEENEK